MSTQKKKRKRKKKQQRKMVVLSVQTPTAQSVQRRSAQAVQPAKKTSSAVRTKGFWAQGFIRLAAFLSLSCFYTEIVFKLSVETLHTGSSFVFLALFSLCAGLVVSGIISMLPKKAVQIVIPFYLVFIFLIFVVEFLIYRQFKVAYDSGRLTVCYLFKCLQTLNL